MHTCYIQIGDHIVFVTTAEQLIIDWLHQHFKVIKADDWDDCLPDIYVRIRNGFGREAESYKVDIHEEDEKVYYEREDYLMEIDHDYRRGLLRVHNELALKHALMAIYSAYIVHYQWGLMIHSSCVAEAGESYLFAGQSGAGKSTVALLSRPRVILSDEATLVRIGEDGVFAYDSPFRSDSSSSFEQACLPLKGIYLLEQSQQIITDIIKPTEAVLRLMDKIFYWAVNPTETVKVLSMCRQLAEQVPSYKLYFQKNDLFWECIS